MIWYDMILFKDLWAAMQSAAVYFCLVAMQLCSSIALNAAESGGTERVMGRGGIFAQKQIHLHRHTLL
jgi:hypothetical protein